jgi:hypothetical protein
MGTVFAGTEDEPDGMLALRDMEEELATRRPVPAVEGVPALGPEERVALAAAVTGATLCADPGPEETLDAPPGVVVDRICCPAESFAFPEGDLARLSRLSPLVALVVSVGSVPAPYSSPTGGPCFGNVFQSHSPPPER